MSGILQQIMNNPDHYSVQELTQGMQDGLIPSYVGVPLVAQKTQQAQAAQAPAPQNQPPIAHQIMQQAQAQGIPALPTQLSTQHAAQGGILGFAEGGSTDDADQDAYEAKSDAEDARLADYNSRGGADIPDRDELEAQNYLDQMKQQQAQYDSGNVPDLENMDSPMASSTLGKGIASLGAMAHSAMSNAVDKLTGKPIAQETQAADQATQAPTATQAPNITDPSASKGINHPFADKIIAAATKYGVNPRLMLDMANNETPNMSANKSATAVSGAGAQGVMQLMPAVAKSLGVRNPFDPDQNIEGSAKLLSQLQKQYSDPHLVAAAYNAGPKAVNKYGGVPPFPETQKYVANLSFREGGIVALAAGGAIKHYAGTTDGSAVSTDDTSNLPLLERLWPTNPKFIEQTNTHATGPGWGGVIGDVAQGIKNPGTFGDTVTGSAWSSLSPEQQPNTTAEPYANETARLGNYPAPTGYFQNVKSGDESDNTPDMSTQSAQDAAKAAYGNYAAPTSTIAAPTTPQTKEQPGTPPILQKYLDYMDARDQEMKKGKADDVNMALISAGMGMMGGTSPFASVNIGQGAQQGLGYLMKANQIRSGDQNQIQSGLLGATRSDLMYQAKEDQTQGRLDQRAQNQNYLNSRLKIDQQAADTKQAQEQANETRNQALAAQQSATLAAHTTAINNNNYLRAGPLVNTDDLVQRYTQMYGKNFATQLGPKNAFDQEVHLRTLMKANSGTLPPENLPSDVTPFAKVQ